MLANLRDKDNLSTVDKTPAPNVSVVWRFHCIAITGFFFFLYTHTFTFFINCYDFADHIEVKMSGLKALCSLVKTSGPILPHSVAVIISRFPVDSLSPSLPPQETLHLLELLLACITSGNRALAIPLSTAIHLFSENCTSSNDQQVCI